MFLLSSQSSDQLQLSPKAWRALSQPRETNHSKPKVSLITMKTNSNFTQAKAISQAYADRPVTPTNRIKQPIFIEFRETVQKLQPVLS